MSENSADQPRLAFEMIAVSVWQALQRVAEADLAGSQLQMGYFELQLPRLAGNNCEQCRSILHTFERIAEDGVYALRRELRRHVAVSAIGILDSCLADVLCFLLLHEPTCIPPGTRQKRPGETAEEFVEEFVRRKLASPWKKIGVSIEAIRHPAQRREEGRIVAPNLAAERHRSPFWILSTSPGASQRAGLG